MDVSNSIGLVKDVTCTASCKPNNDGEPTIISCMMDFYMQGDLPVCQPAACLNSSPIGRGVTHVAMRMYLMMLVICFCVADYKLIDREDFFSSGRVLLECWSHGGQCLIRL